MRGAIGLARVVFVVFAAAAGFAPGVSAQGTTGATQGLIQSGTTVQVSDHVYVIPDHNQGLVPNVGIVVGSQATLVVDTGLGPINAQTILREVAQVSRGRDLYVVSTHYHPEHAAGESAFPDTAWVLRARAQQADIDERGLESLLRFRSISPLIEELLTGVQYRIADAIFEREHELDLGGVRVQLMAWGPTHTRGDTMAFVEEDRVLLAGDVVMQERFVVPISPESSIDTWIEILDELESLAPTAIVPSHGAMGDAGMLTAQRRYLDTVRARVRELKAQGQSADDVAATVTDELRASYSDWTGDRWIEPAARAAYREAP